ncbi:MAG: hypothetical protein JW862_18860, partial [Anaerolineales bacterium]|nr:hypothetical protein [Anaerolineales bacterium]
MKRKSLLLVVLLMGLVLALSACATEAPECPECPEVECPDCPDCPEAPECPECPEVECPGPVGGEVPFEILWAGSGHADATAEAFRHWDGDDPAVVSAACAKCHSTAGYLDFLGADGSAAGMIDAEVPALDAMGVTCVACHNDATSVKTSVVMPSGIELTGLGDEARCMECHQGRESKMSVDAKVAELAGVAVEEVATVDQDAVLEGLGFRNVHYYPAAATKYGTYAMGGYQYAGKTYDGNFAHVEEYDTCIECHNPHTLEIEAQGCVMCHGEGEFADYRMEGSLVDYDGDGDMEEGVAFEIATLQEILYAEMQAYADNVTGTGLSYDSAAYPYFFDGAGERLSTWTPRLLHAAYNYQLSLKDPGGYAHNGKYIIQLLFDSIEDLNPEAVAGLYRIDHGHFAGSEEAFRHWDEDGEVEAACAKCHSATGLPTFAKEGVNISAEISNGFQCVTCHGGGQFPELFTFETVTFPSGAEVAVEAGDPSGLCMQCHQGRSSGVAVARAIGDQPRDELGQGLRFLNIHYFAAGATRYGSEVTGMYEFEGQEYVGLFGHVPGFQTCAQCHDAHALEVKTE